MTVADANTVQEQQINPQDNPYVGPTTFAPEDAHKFFGRDIEARELEALIVANRLVLFYAPSGAGKSSLLNTKIRPALAAEGFELLPTGRVSGFTGNMKTPNIFIFNLLLSLHEQKETAADFSQSSLAGFLDNLVRHSDGKYAYDPDYVYPDHAEFKPRVLIIDQFEELLTTNTAHFGQRGNFFEQLSALLAYDEELRVVLTMREDFVARLDSYLHLTPNRLRHRYYMDLLTPEAALEVITLPVAQIRPFEDDAAKRLVKNLRKRRVRVDGKEVIQLDEFVEPVKLQAVCYQMWEKLRNHPGKTITQNNVAQFANVDKALINFYEDMIAKTVRKQGISETELRTWFDRELITEAGTSNTVFRGEKTVGNLPTEIADYINKEHFILNAIVQPGGIWYKLVHDSFVYPIVTANQKWRQEQPLIRLATQWDEAKRPQNLLLTGPQLEQLGDDWQVLGPLVAEYIAAGQAARQDALAKEEVAKVAQQKREMAQQEKLARQNHELAVASKEQAHKAKKLAAEKELFAKVQARRTRIMAIALAGVVLLALIAIAGVGIFNLNQVRIAQAQAEEAQVQAIIFSGETEEGQATRVALEDQRDQLSAEAGQLKATITTQSESLISAGEDITALQAANAALVSTFNATPLPTLIPAATPTSIALLTPVTSSGISEIAFSGIINGDQNLIGYRFASSDFSSNSIKDGAIGLLTNDLLEQSDPTWSCNGRLAYVQYNSNNDQWELIVQTNGTKVSILSGNSGVVIRRPAWSPDGKTLAFDWGRDGNHDIFTITASQSNPGAFTNLRQLTTNVGNDYHASFSPDGQSLVFYSLRDGNREIYLLENINAGQSIPERLTNSPGDDQRPTWSPNSNWIVFDSARDGNWDIWVMNLEERTTFYKLTNGSEYDWSATWSPDGKTIAFLSERTGVGQWQIHAMDFDDQTFAQQVNVPQQLTYASDVLQPLSPDWQPLPNSCK